MVSQTRYGKLTFGGGDGSKLSLFGFNFNDNASVLDDSTGVDFANYGWRNVGGGGTFTVVPPGSSVLLNGALCLEQLPNQLRRGGFAKTVSARCRASILDLTSSTSWVKTTWSTALRWWGCRPTSKPSIRCRSPWTQQENTTELGGYLDYTVKRGAWIVQPSVRLQYYSSLGYARLEPRFGVKYKASERLRLKAAGGMYSQNVISANSDRDVVNLFYGFLAGPQNLQDEINLPDGRCARDRETACKRPTICGGWF